MRRHGQQVHRVQVVGRNLYPVVGDEQAAGVGERGLGAASAASSSVDSTRSDIPGVSAGAGRQRKVSVPRGTAQDRVHNTAPGAGWSCAASIIDGTGRPVIRT
ncbi:hypothetical protein CS0771_60340 [Catellatospora sp. IY07-71]|nr:hypothetical protein CS0771_60340 [Catellatospora sp. IY07-71]